MLGFALLYNKQLNGNRLLSFTIFILTLIDLRPVF